MPQESQSSAEGSRVVDRQPHRNYFSPSVAGWTPYTSNCNKNTEGRYAFWFQKLYGTRMLKGKVGYMEPEEQML